MDNLKAFLRSLPDDEARKVFAARCGSSLGHLRNIIYSGKACAPKLAAQIDVHSRGQVTRRDLRPKDWAHIWPELAETTRA